MRSILRSTSSSFCGSLSCMSKFKAQTRVLVNANGTTGRLINIRELSKGTLTINPAGGSFAVLYGEHHEKIEEKYSIHISEKGTGRGNLLHYTLVTKTHPRVDGYQFTTAFKNDLWCFLYAQAARGLPTNLSSPLARDKDRVENALPFNSEISTLIMNVYVGPPSGKGTPFPTSKLYYVVTLPFKYYSVAIAVSHSPFPTHPIGKTFSMFNGMSFDKQEVPGSARFEAIGHELNALREQCESYMNILHIGCYQTAIDESNGEAPMTEFLGDLFAMGLQKWPYEINRN